MEAMDGKEPVRVVILENGPVLCLNIFDPGQSKLSLLHCNNTIISEKNPAVLRFVGESQSNTLPPYS